MWNTLEKIIKYEIFLKHENMNNLMSNKSPNYNNALVKFIIVVRLLIF